MYVRTYVRTYVGKFKFTNKICMLIGIDFFISNPVFQRIVGS